MNEIVGDLWRFWHKGNWVVIPTNGEIDSHGLAVMGAGVALRASKEILEMPELLALYLREYGNVPGLFYNYRVISFPTKNKWREKSNIDLIESSAIDLVSLVSIYANTYEIGNIYLPRVGCGLGQLSWDIVKPVLGKHFDDRFYVVEYE